MKRASTFYCAVTLATALTSLAVSKAWGAGGREPSSIPNATAPSYIYERNGVEILTYETQPDYNKLQELLKASEAAQPQPGELVHRFYRSGIDGSVQPYMLWLPRDYSRAKTYSLVIQLHGTNFHEVLSGERLNQRGLRSDTWIIPNLPVICAQCFGGPTTFYQGIGEVDVLQVIQDVKRRYPVDPDRVFIMGHSMGGGGTYTVGLHQPDQFGGLLPIDPAMAPMASAVPPDVPKWMQPQIDIVSPAKLYANARNVDVFFKNAGAGVQRNSTQNSDGIVAAGGFATTEVMPGQPHSFGDQYPYANWIPELIAHPVRRHPSEVKFWTNTLQYNHAYWVTLDRLTRHNADASVTATCTGTTVQVATANLDALTLQLSDTPLPKATAASLIVDGREVLGGSFPAVVHLAKAGSAWKVGQWPGSGLAKTHGLQGPIGDAFNARFLAVYGKGDRELAIAELDAVRNPPGPFDIHGDFPMKAAAKVTAEDIRSGNLILFGTPESNPIIKRLAPSFPAEVVKNGSIFIYPNPESPRHYVVVWTTKLLSLPDHGLRGGWIMPLNLLPDYVQITAGKIVAGGHFDSDWKFNPSGFVAAGPPAAVPVAAPSAEATSGAAPPAAAPPGLQSRPFANRGAQGGAAFARFQNPWLTDTQREAQRAAMNQEEAAKVADQIRQAAQALKAAVLAKPCDPKVVQEKAQALAKLQADQTAQRLQTVAAIAATLTEEQRERIQSAPADMLPFQFTSFANAAAGMGGGGRFQGMGPGGGQGGQWRGGRGPQ